MQRGDQRHNVAREVVPQMQIRAQRIDRHPAAWAQLRTQELHEFVARVVLVSPFRVHQIQQDEGDRIERAAPSPHIDT